MSTEKIAGSMFDGRYELLETIGSGAMATVWLAIDRQSSEFVALKFPDESINRRRFAHELRVHVQLENCPHIVRLFDVAITENGEPYLVMEYFAGESLAELLERQRLARSEFYCIARQLTQGVAELWKHKVVHRDLKPQNVMVRADCSYGIKILDLGIAKALDGSRWKSGNLTEAHTIVGTPIYLAPEVIKEGSQRADHGSDLFALGCIFYLMLTGRTHVRDSHNIQDILTDILQELPRERYPRTGNPHLEALVLSLLARDPAGRPKDTNEVMQQLSRAQNWEEERELWRNTPIFQRRGVRRLLASALCLLVMLLIALLTNVVSSKAMQERSTPRRGQISS